MYPLDNVHRSPSAPLTTIAPAARNMTAGVSPAVSQVDIAAPKISTLARQLSECAERAAVRDKTLSREELGNLASRLHDQLSSGRYVGGNIPKMLARSNADDPELLHRDHQAVLYNVNSMFGDKSLQSPFHGLSRQDMVLILYDESDTFTINERYAAFLGANQLEQNFRENYCRRNFEGAFNEHPFLGYAEPLMHYRSLPLIEQARYPEDYEARLESWMLEAWAEKPATDSKEFKTLFETIAQVLRNGNRSEDFIKAALEPVEKSDAARSIKTSS